MWNFYCPNPRYFKPLEYCCSILWPDLKNMGKVGYKVQNAQAQNSTHSQAFWDSERKMSTFNSPASAIICITGTFQTHFQNMRIASNIHGILSCILTVTELKSVLKTRLQLLNWIIYLKLRLSRLTREFFPDFSWNITQGEFLPYPQPCLDLLVLPSQGN